MVNLPKENGLDHTFDLLTEGYRFMQKRFDSFQTKVFETRLMGKKMICMVGREAVELFYDASRFQRSGAIPKRVQKTLFGEKGIQTMDGSAHHVRKALFLSLMTKERLSYLQELTLEQWRARTKKWTTDKSVVLFDEAEEVLCEVACLWAGVPLKESEVSTRAYDLGALIDALGGVGPRYREGRDARIRTEKWIESLIEEYRRGEIPHNGSALEAIAKHRDENGNLLDTHMAAVELINIIRPIVAVARFIIFGMLALYQFPEEKNKIRQHGDHYLENFVQEVRRYYPFAPFLGAMAKTEFEWKGVHFKKGDTVLIDLYGTNHDPECWRNPDQFKPDRFDEEQVDLYNFVPQGGGHVTTGHRCPGEDVTVTIMKASIFYFVNELDYEVLQGQDLSINMARLPTLPNSRMVIQKQKNF
ncbi:fatty-acid peroxygenase [Sporosarcina sp. NCCP-2222]|uniref:cytochrome P450 n=1 Tax=Sporosarcina sp. NCCP-2222 TaxID=2935073 RepID=UPI0020872C5B|nr:cytochrome P450 [Sporosarcina sp. NCCP-2222]GKV56825.1 fatty-acid peroxygenase [Sporosarcina sp. NCCP-2222]